MLLNQDKRPAHVLLGKDTIKSEILPHLFVTKRGWDSKCDLAEVIPRISLQVGKLVVNGNNFCFSSMLPPLAKSSIPATARVGGSTRMCFPCHFPLRVVSGIIFFV